MIEQLTLESVAQTLQDMYYRDFSADDDYFDNGFFENLCRAIYGKMLDTEANQWRKVARQDEGFYNINLTPEWLVEENVKVSFDDGPKVWSGKLSDLPFAFQFDKWSRGIHTVASHEIEKLERTTYEKVKELRHLPYTGVVFWFPFREKVNIVAPKSSKISEIQVSYLPSLTGENASKAYVPLGKHMEIITAGYQVMEKVKNGGPIDTTNNGNGNVALQTEIDNVFANTRTKPV